MRRRTIRALLAVAAIGFALVAARPAAAHPLGNFTINHYAGITVAPAAVDLDVVIDMAEIPTFQERRHFDTDGDGTVSDGETAAAEGPACETQKALVHLSVGGARAALESAAATISFPSGLGGLSTMRLECTFVARLATPLADGTSTSISFEDVSYPERIGWREIVATGDGATVTTDGLPATSVSKRLTAYPADLISRPLDIRSATIVASPMAGSDPETAAGGGAVGAPANAARVGAVPGGIGGELPSIFREVDLTPVVLLVSILTAFGLGAGHALTPGHGKTLMAAYLVGSRGRPIHAVGLGLSVTVSHTLGILVLAALVVGAQGLLPPDVVVRAAPAIAAVTIAGLGGWMLIAEVRKRLAARRAGAAHARAHADDLPHEHVHQHAATPDDPHSHGGVAHSHLPAGGSALSWRGLFALGLAGGLIPSTSALFILLGSIVAGRPAFGFVLVVIFGLGMALVMTTIGLAMVFARGRLDRLPAGTGLGRLAGQLPLVAAVVVLGFGLYLSIQAIGGPPVL